MVFEFYVLNYDSNKRCVETFNIFRNIRLNEATEHLVKEYLVSKEEYTSQREVTLKGFTAFCEELRRLISWQERGRREYEIYVGDSFETNINKFEKWDCYSQVEPNISIIAREVIYQYESQSKNTRKKSKSAKTSKVL